jgi:hypothetical protein
MRFQEQQKVPNEKINKKSFFFLSKKVLLITAKVPKTPIVK